MGEAMLARCVCVCVPSVWARMDVKLLFYAGACGPHVLTTRNVAGFLYPHIYLYILYIYIPPPCAHLSRSWGGLYFIPVIIYGQSLM